MKFIYLLALVAFALIILSCSSGKIKNMDHNNVKDPKFTKEWKEIENLEKKGLYRSALSIADSIYDLCAYRR